MKLEKAKEDLKKLVEKDKSKQAAQKSGVNTSSEDPKSAEDEFELDNQEAEMIYFDC
jgi:hypothetical protein